MTIALKLEIDNVYEDEKIRTFVETQVPEPPLDRDSTEYEEWEQDYIFSTTGTGRTEGDAGYFVTVTDSSRPDLIPVGTEYEYC